jgi:transcriptional regulator with XRE-family HTH domain
MSSNPNEIRGFPLASDTAVTLGCARVTVAEAFRLSLDALMRAQGKSGADITRATGLSSATITKLKNGERFASVTVLERLRQVFRVTPADLFDPDKALAQIGLTRTGGENGQLADTRNPAKRTLLDAPTGDPLRSESPSLLEGGSALANHPDPELLAALHVYWDGMSPDQRFELVGLGRRMRSASPPSAPPMGHTAGFKRG